MSYLLCRFGVTVLVDQSFHVTTYEVEFGTESYLWMCGQSQMCLQQSLM